MNAYRQRSDLRILAHPAGKKVAKGTLHRRRLFAVPVDSQYIQAVVAGGRHPDMLN